MKSQIFKGGETFPTDYLAQKKTWMTTVFKNKMAFYTIS